MATPLSAKIVFSDYKKQTNKTSFTRSFLIDDNVVVENRKNPQTIVWIHTKKLTSFNHPKKDQKTKC